MRKVNSLIKTLMFSVLYCLLFTSCEQEKEDTIDLTPQEILKQKFSFDSFVNTPALKKENLVIDWSSFVLRKGRQSVFYEFSIKNSSTAVLNIDGYNSKMDYQLLARFNDSNQPEYFLVELLPSLDNEQEKLSYLNIMTYSGMVYLYDMNGEKISVESYEHGELQVKALDKSIGQSLMARTPSKCAILEGLEPVECSGGGNSGGCSTRNVVVQSWKYWYNAEVDTRTGVVISATYSHREFLGSSVRQVTTCSGSTGQTNTGNNAVSRTNLAILPDGTETDDAFFEFTILDFGDKIDPIKELKCFNINQGAKLTIYVQQPNENSDDVMGSNSVGHAFIGIEQNGIKRQFGFYPDQEANTFNVGVGKTYDSEIRSNNDYLYHVSISKQISASQLKSIINYTKSSPTKYNVNSFACVDFAIEAGKKGGINLPSTTVSTFMFNGRSPGKLGQEIRAMSSNGTIKINKTKNKSPKKEGGC